jgi:hypothetical protein
MAVLDRLKSVDAQDAGCMVLARSCTVSRSSSMGTVGGGMGIVCRLTLGGSALVVLLPSDLLEAMAP